MLYRQYGGPDRLESAEIPRPEPPAGQLLVAVRRTSVNPVDWKLASGKYRPILSVERPAVPGLDVVGDVVALGPGVSGFAPGNRVHGRVGNLPGGACAELACLEVAQAAKVPDGMDLATAAGLPLAGVTALQGLRDAGGLPLHGATQKVLVVGASGGVGHLAVQIARATGASVTGVCSGRNVARVQALGATEVIDYTRPDAWSGRGPWDLVYDCVGGDPGPWFARVAPKGRYVSCVPGPMTFFWSVAGALRGVKVVPVLLKPNAADVAWLDTLSVAGKLTVLVDSTWPLDALGKAWERSISGRAVGKIIVEVA